VVASYNFGHLLSLCFELAVKAVGALGAIGSST